MLRTVPAAVGAADADLAAEPADTVHIPVAAGVAGVDARRCRGEMQDRASVMFGQTGGFAGFAGSAA